MRSIAWWGALCYLLGAAAGYGVPWWFVVPTAVLLGVISPKGRDDA